LVNDLNATRQPWKIAVFHRAPYSALGEHGSDPLVRSVFEPIFSAHDVALVLSGHEHDYERTTPQQRTPGTLGVTYIVTGGGGARLYPAGIAPWTAASASAYHYLRGVVDPCRVAVEAVGLDGVVFDQVTLLKCAPPTQPYMGRAAVVPGTIQAEHFDDGAEGAAYHDLSAANEGGYFRPTGVDLEPSSDTGDGANVGWVFPGEWLTYTITVAAPITVDVFARVSSPGLGGTLGFVVDDVPAAGTLQIPATGGWQQWQTVRGPRLPLTAGVHRLRVEMRSVSAPGAAVGNINAFTLQAAP
jgi:hypothetical protein